MKKVNAKKMNTRTDNRNRENMTMLLPVFRYSKPTNRRLEAIIEQTGIDYFSPLYTGYKNAGF